MKIPLERISYDDLLKLSIEQRTQLFVKDKEIERLNYIINEIEKELDKGFEVYICNGRKAGKSIELGYKICQKELLNKLKEFKGVDKE